MKTKNKPARRRVCILAQLCKYIPSHAVSRIARELGDEQKSRTFSAWSHVVSLLYAQLCHCISLPDVCDALALRKSRLSLLRGATPPKRNTLSHANRKRNPELMEKLFWETLNHLRIQSPEFGPAGRYSGVPRRFKKTIHAIDSSTISLVANCMDWAKHRRRKAAAKLHLTLNMQTFLPTIAVVEEASHHDATRARELCVPLKEGEIVVFDKAYVDFKHLHELDERGIFWVTRAKDNMSYEVVKELPNDAQQGIIRDQLIILNTEKSQKAYPKQFRLVTARVELNGKEVEMTFISNNTKWAASSVAGLYQSRWGIEVFFKQLKQTLKLSGFIGYSKEAIQWQIWAALLVWLLSRYAAFVSGWSHSFSRLMALLRSYVWDKFDLSELLKFHGTAGGLPRMVAEPGQAYFVGFEPR
jgi:hypothetical protein